MSKTIPTNWLTTTFDEVFSQISTTGKKVKTGETQLHGKFPVVDQGRTFISGYLNDESLVVSNDQPLIIFGDHTREIKWIDFPFIPGADGVKILKPDDELSPRYMYYFLRNLPIESKGYARHFKCLKEAVYLLPPLAEQTRIAQKLDELLAQVDTLKARLYAIPALLKRFRQSVLAAAVSGRLTEEWRNTNEQSQHQSLLRTLSHLKKFKSEQIKLKNIKNDLAFGENSTDGEHLGAIPDAWEKLRIKDISIKVTDGEHSTPKRQDHGHYLISARNIGNSEIILSDVDYVGDEEYQRIRKRCDPSIGDVLISCSGSVGRVSLVDKDDAYVMVRSVALIRPAPEAVNIKYLMYFLQSPFTQVQIATRSKSTAQANLFLGEIKEIELAYPCLEEQTEIVRRVEQLLALADQLEAKVASAKSRIDHLTQSILAKAFRGELVPQAPNDEPASVLLERIKAQRAAAPKVKRGRKASA